MFPAKGIFVAAFEEDNSFIFLLFFYEIEIENMLLSIKIIINLPQVVIYFILQTSHCWHTVHCSVFTVIFAEYTVCLLYCLNLEQL